MSRYLSLILALSGCTIDFETKAEADAIARAAELRSIERVNVTLNLYGREPQRIRSRQVFVSQDSLGEIVVFISSGDSVRVIMSPADCWLLPIGSFPAREFGRPKHPWYAPEHLGDGILTPPPILKGCTP